VGASWLPIRTLVREGEQFVAIEGARVPSDAARVDGAIELVVDGLELVTREAWGDVVALWRAVLDGLEDFAVTGAAVIEFPEQPIELRLRRSRAGGMTVEVDDGEPRRAAVDEAEFLAAALEAARRFAVWTARVGVHAPAAGGGSR
jgi:hypothetical protein